MSLYKTMEVMIPQDDTSYHHDSAGRHFLCYMLGHNEKGTQSGDTCPPNRTWSQSKYNIIDMSCRIGKT